MARRWREERYMMASVGMCVRFLGRSWRQKGVKGGEECDQKYPRTRDDEGAATKDDDSEPVKASMI